jgi:transglutaminase-like putative cysteine protease
MSHRYRIVHTTEYRYPAEVSVSYGRAHLLPHAAAGQSVDDATLTVEPAAAEQRDHVDFFGNRSTYYAVRTPHRALRVTAESHVRVERAVANTAALDRPWEDGRDAPGAGVTDRAFVLPSPSVPPVPAMRTYAAASFAPGRAFGAALRELVARIHADFAYVPGTTTINTPLTEVLQRREGVCQDFAHLAVGGLRSLGLAARYVSGYLETDPPPGQPKLQGADASHAWASVLGPDGRWLDVDPTNDQFVDDRYVVAAVGRDYSDVPPLKGVILSHGTGSTLHVAVDVTRIG